VVLEIEQTRENNSDAPSTKGFCKEHLAKGRCPSKISKYYRKLSL
jgi:hypothetical protein